ncbi:MAG TPA: VOC family protein [Acidimicrobiales bacterium]|nr:VOC family protein [Acidimicrobiales bacterium]
MRITGLDHIVLNTPDQERSLAWYTGVLGLAGERIEEWRRGEVPFPSVRIDAGTIIDLFRSEPPAGTNDETERPNLNHFCLVLPAADWDAMMEAGDIPVERGPSNVFGARGMGVSIYTRDPDGNVVELRRYDD